MLCWAWMCHERWSLCALPKPRMNVCLLCARGWTLEREREKQREWACEVGVWSGRVKWACEVVACKSEEVRQDKKLFECRPLAANPILVTFAALSSDIWPNIATHLLGTYLCNSGSAVQIWIKINVLIKGYGCECQSSITLFLYFTIFIIWPSFE